MKKIFLLLSFVLLIACLSLAQSRFNAGASFDVNFPVGDFANIAKTGTGISLLGEYNISNKLSAIVTFSYQSYKSEIPIIAALGETFVISFKGLPFSGGVRYYFNQNIFGTLKAGVNLLKANVDVSSLYNEDKISSDYQTKFTAGIGAGFRIPISEQSLFEVSGLYQYVQDDFSAVTLRAAILILLDKL